MAFDGDAKVDYFLKKPSDKSETDRLDLQHETWLLTLDGQAHLAPTHGGPHTVLDIGCGSGTWAVAYASSCPDATVIGIDLDPPSRERLGTDCPSNCNFIKTNVEGEDPWPVQDNSITYIHVRLLTLGIRDWSRFFSRCFSILKPGGWLEVSDMVNNGESAVGYDKQTSSFLYQLWLGQEGTERQGCEWRPDLHHPSNLNAAGFEHVEQKMFDWKFGPWGETEKDRKIGQLTMDNTKNMMASWVTRMKILWSEMSENELQRLNEKGQKELNNQWEEMKFLKYFVVHLARKPQR